MNAPTTKLLMCSPRYFRVEYVINPWMDGNVGRADPAVAMQQWEKLRTLLAEHAEVELIPEDPALADMPFMANAGLVLGDIFVPSQFLFPERRPETPHDIAWLRDHGYKVVPLQGGASFEGEGDALFHPGARVLWSGYGVRTSLEAYKEIAEILSVELIPLRLVDERFYHLDTCFCPLSGGRVFYYPAAFDLPSLQSIEAYFPAERRFAVSETDALHFACNAVEISGSIFANYFGEQLRAQLTAWGLNAVATPLMEFMRAGGAAKCLVLRLTQDVPAAVGARPAMESTIRDRTIELRGHLLDSGLINAAVDMVTEMGGSFEIEQFQPGLRRDQESIARVRITAPSAARLDAILTQLIQKGARICFEEVNARTSKVVLDGVAPDDFYSTTIFPTDVRIDGEWVRASGQRMDVVLRVERDSAKGTNVGCALIRDLRQGDEVISGVEGIRIHAVHAAKSDEAFSFMSAGVSSERRVELTVEEIAWDMKRIRERGGKIVVVAGPVVIHTGGGPHLARLVREGFVQALLGGNAIAVHDLEQSIFGTSLGVDMKRGVGVHGGHRHHLRVINSVRAAGGIAQAVEQGLVTAGVMYECVRAGVPFSLAGSIRDDGPLPDTEMDLLKAQSEYASLIQGADMILMLSSMLHSIGTGNMTPSGVKLICVDISPAVVTKLADRGSVESVGIVTDVGLFLNLLSARLCGSAEK